MTRQQAMERDKKFVEQGKITKEEFRRRWFPTKQELKRAEVRGKAMLKEIRRIQKLSKKDFLEELRKENQ